MADGRGGRELPGQALPQSLPTPPLRRDTGGRGEKGKPGAGDNGLATVRGSAGPSSLLLPRRHGGVGPGGRAGPGEMSCAVRRNATDSRKA